MNSNDKRDAFLADIKGILVKYGVELRGWDDGSVIVLNYLQSTGPTEFEAEGVFEDDK